MPRASNRSTGTPSAANRRHVLAHYGMDRMIEAYRALFDGALARSGRG
jgi:hypothetical protein